MDRTIQTLGISAIMTLIWYTAIRATMKVGDIRSHLFLQNKQARVCAMKNGTMGMQYWIAASRAICS